MRTTNHRCQSTTTIRLLSPSSPLESSTLELNTSVFAITSVRICIINWLSTTSTHTETKMWKTYSRKHLLMLSIRSSLKQWVNGSGGFRHIDLFPYIDGHPQATVVLFPCSHATQGFNEATVGITDCLFVCSFAPQSVSTGGSVACMVYLPDVWFQLGWCIISPRWWWFLAQLEMQTQLQMPAECAWMHTRLTLKTVYIWAWMYLYLEYKFLSISISTDTRSGITNYRLDL